MKGKKKPSKDVIHQQEAQKQLEEYNNKYLRALADYQNLEKRIESITIEIQKRTKINILKKFLLILDDLEKAEIFVNDKGLQMVAKQFAAIFSESGVLEMDLIDTEYDPYVAEAIEIVEGDKDNIITEVIRKGYMLGDEVLRPAQVIVTKKN